MGSSKAIFRVLLITLLVLLATLVDKTEQQCAASQNYQIIPSSSIKDNAPNVIRLGVIGTLYSLAYGPPGSIMRYAAQRINENPDLLPDTRIELAFIPNPPSVTDLSSSLLLALFAIQNLTVDGIIGGLSTTESRVIQLAAKLYSVPQISAHAAAEVLANKDEYPYYACTTPYDRTQVDTMVALFKYLKWRRAVVLYNDNDYGAGFNNLRVKGADADIDFVGLPISASAQTESQIEDQMLQVKHQMAEKKYRVCVLYLTANSTVLVMKTAMRLGLVGNQYSYVLSTNAAGVYSQTIGEEIKPFLKGSIAVTLPFPAGPFYNQELAEYEARRAANPRLGYPMTTSATRYFWVLYDPVMTYAYAFDTLLKKGVPFDQIKGQMLYNQILNTTYVGVTGQMTYNPGGDRKGFYTITNFDGNTSTEVAQYSLFTDSITTLQDFVFYDGTTNIPDDGTGRAFSKGLAGGLGAIVGVGVLVAFFAIAMLVLNWGVFIKKYGVFYCGVILSGVLTSYIAAFSLLPEPTDALCVVFPWFLGIAFTLVYGCLFIKAWILYRLWRYALQLKRLSITALTVVKYVGVALAIEILIHFVDRLDSSRSSQSTYELVDGTYMAQCHSDTPVFWIIFLSMKGVWLLFGVVVSVLTRSVVKEYNNFTEFAYAMYNILIMVIIAVPLGVLLEEVPNGVLIVSVIVIVLAFMFTTIILFFNIWYSLLYNDQMPAVSSMQAKSSRSPSQSKITENSHSNGSNDASSRA